MEMMKIYGHMYGDEIGKIERDTYRTVAKTKPPLLV